MLEGLDFLDAPRQALWNFGRGVKGLISGDADIKDILPGLLGGGLTAGLAATGVGLPLAILGGSALGGLNQAAYGNQAVSPSDVVKGLGVDPESTGGMLGSFALSAATDPLSYAGLGMGGKALAREAQARRALPELGAAIPVEQALGKAEAAGGLLPKSADPVNAFFEMDPLTKMQLHDASTKQLAADRLLTEHAIWSNKLNDIQSINPHPGGALDISSLTPELRDAMKERYMRASIQRDIAPRLGINEVPLPGMLNKEMSDLNQLRTRYVAGLEDSDLSRSADLVKYYHPSEQGIESLTRIAPDLGFHGVGKEDFRKMFLPEATDAYLTRADQMWNHLDPEEIAKEARTIDQMLASIAKDERLMKISPQEFIGGITDLAKQHVRGPSYDEMFGINRRAVERAANEAQLRQMREADRLFGTGPVVTPVPTQAQQLPSSARSYLEQILAGTRMPRDYNQNTDSLATILETIQQHMEHPAARGANAESHLSELINRLGL